MDVGTDLQLTDTRALRGNLTITGGTFTLTPAFTGSFNIGGNWSRTGATSAFVHNSKKVVFDRQSAGNQTISVSTGVTEEVFYDLEVSPASGDLMLGTPTNLIIQNNLNFVSGKLNLSSSSNLLSIGTTTLNGAISGFGSTKYIVADAGSIKLFTTSNTAYNFPMGDNTNYTPLDLSLTNGGQSDAFIVGKVTNLKHPEMTVTTTDFIGRYWSINPTGLAASPVYNVSYTYAASDISGTASSIYPVKYSSLGWIAGFGTPGAVAMDGTASGHNVGSQTFTWTGLTTFSEFSGAGNPSPLPIELLSFDAKPLSDNTVEVSWITASEINNNYFTVERSLDAINFEPLARVSGAGNSTLTNAYRYLDKNPARGISYYRLRQTDFNGDTEVFDPASVNLTVIGTLVTVYPNPASEFVVVDTQCEKSGKTKIELIDISGRIVHQAEFSLQQGSNKVHIDLSAFEKGNYVLMLIDSTGYRSVNKILINR
jgi:hypothetical protein